MKNSQWIRKIELFLTSGGKGLDLSQFHITFIIKNADNESPNYCAIRVYNVNPQTLEKIKEFTDVTLNAGYVQGNFGKIFQGQIKQFRIGRENATDTYIDILAADGDIGYNQGVSNSTHAPGTKLVEILEGAIKDMPGLTPDILSLKTGLQSKPIIRSVIRVGLSRAAVRNIANTLDASWSIQEGKVVLIDTKGYHDGEAVMVNAQTGMIGTPEQTDEGIRVKCLLNSKIRIGNRVKLNNTEITTLIQQDTNPGAGQLQFNSNKQLQYSGIITGDGMYRAFVVEHEGDTRGNPWFTNLILLAVDETAPQPESVQGL